jgi:hypothetical protein
MNRVSAKANVVGCVDETRQKSEELLARRRPMLERLMFEILRLPNPAWVERIAYMAATEWGPGDEEAVAATVEKWSAPRVLLADREDEIYQKVKFLREQDPGVFTSYRAAAAHVAAELGVETKSVENTFYSVQKRYRAQRPIEPASMVTEVGSMVSPQPGADHTDGQ